VGGWFGHFEPSFVRQSKFSGCNVGSGTTLYQIYVVGSDNRGREKKIFLNDVQREAVYFVNIPYKSDLHINY
jgi:hypothetical protein